MSKVKLFFVGILKFLESFLRIVSFVFIVFLYIYAMVQLLLVQDYLQFLAACIFLVMSIYINGKVN